MFLRSFFSWRSMMPNEPYEEKAYEAALRTTKSPLVKLFNHVELEKKTLQKSTSPGLSRGAGSYPGSTGARPVYPERVVSGSRFLHFQPMPQSLAKILIHTVFSTKDRRPFLRDKALREELHRYLGS